MSNIKCDSCQSRSSLFDEHVIEEVAFAGTRYCAKKLLRLFLLLLEILIIALVDSLLKSF